jgi:hypothetical protein
MQGSADTVKHSAEKSRTEVDGKEITGKSDRFTNMHPRGVFVNLQVHPGTVDSYDFAEKALFSDMDNFIKRNRSIRPGLDNRTRYACDRSRFFHHGHLTP